MAKVSFNKLGLKINDDIKTLIFNEQEIEIKQYLTMNTKLDIIGNILNYCAEDEKFYNPGKLEVYYVLEIIDNYTNIKFTDKQKEDPCKLYDLLVSSGLKDIIFREIPKQDLDSIYIMIFKVIESVYKYNNSIYGLLDNISNDYNGLNFNIDDMWKKLSDRENVEFLQEIIQKMG